MLRSHPIPLPNPSESDRNLQSDSGEHNVFSIRSFTQPARLRSELTVRLRRTQRIFNQVQTVPSAVFLLDLTSVTLDNPLSSYRIFPTPLWTFSRPRHSYFSDRLVITNQVLTVHPTTSPSFRDLIDFTETGECLR